MSQAALCVKGLYSEDQQKKIKLVDEFSYDQHSRTWTKRQVPRLFPLMTEGLRFEKKSSADPKGKGKAKATTSTDEGSAPSEPAPPAAGASTSTQLAGTSLSSALTHRQSACSTSSSLQRVDATPSTSTSSPSTSSAALPITSSHLSAPINLASASFNPSSSTASPSNAAPLSRIELMEQAGVKVKWRSWKKMGDDKTRDGLPLSFVNLMKDVGWEEAWETMLKDGLRGREVLRKEGISDGELDGRVRKERLNAMKDGKREEYEKRVWLAEAEPVDMDGKPIDTSPAPQPPPFDTPPAPLTSTSSTYSPIESSHPAPSPLDPFSSISLPPTSSANITVVPNIKVATASGLKREREEREGRDEPAREVEPKRRRRGEKREEEMAKREHQEREVDIAEGSGKRRKKDQVVDNSTPLPLPTPPQHLSTNRRSTQLDGTPHSQSLPIPPPPARAKKASTASIYKPDSEPWARKPPDDPITNSDHGYVLSEIERDLVVSQCIFLTNDPGESFPAAIRIRTFDHLDEPVEISRLWSNGALQALTNDSIQFSQALNESVPMGEDGKLDPFALRVAQASKTRTRNDARREMRRKSLLAKGVYEITDAMGLIDRRKIIEADDNKKLDPSDITFSHLTSVLNSSRPIIFAIGGDKPSKSPKGVHAASFGHSIVRELYKSLRGRYGDRLVAVRLKETWTSKLCPRATCTRGEGGPRSWVAEGLREDKSICHRVTTCSQCGGTNHRDLSAARCQRDDSVSMLIKRKRLFAGGWKGTD